MKRLSLLIVLAIVGIGIFMFIKRSTPFSDSEEIMSANISIDSIWTIGPAAAIYDKGARRYYWLKSYTSLDQSALDTLKTKRATVRYIKFFMGPLENRIFRMQVDSVVVFDQIIEREPNGL